jgi:hypothetical protein
MMLYSIEQFALYVAYIDEKNQHGEKTLLAMVQNIYNTGTAEQQQQMTRRSKRIQQIQKRIDDLYNEISEIVVGAKLVACLQACKQSYTTEIQDDHTNNKITFNESTNNPNATHTIKFLKEINDSGEIQISEAFTVDHNWFLALLAFLLLYKREAILTKILKNEGGTEKEEEQNKKIIENLCTLQIQLNNAYGYLQDFKQYLACSILS